MPLGNASPGPVAEGSDDLVRPAVLGVLDADPRAAYFDALGAWRLMLGRAIDEAEAQRVRAIYEQGAARYRSRESREDGPPTSEAVRLQNEPEEGETLAERGSAPRRRGNPASDTDADAPSGRLTSDAEAASQLSAGQIVIVTARWLLIVTGFVVTLWLPTQADLDTVRIVLLVLFALGIGNFFLHAQILMRRRLERSILYAASAADIAIITLIVWRTGGLESGSFVYYYPALLALSLVFPLRVAVYFAAGLMLAYAVVCLPTAHAQADLQVLVARLIALLAVGVVGYIYQDIERRRRERSMEKDGLGLEASARLA